MCVANLSVSTQPCRHRWYELVRACSAERNLSNCPDRLKLEGWETRKDVCPWCEGVGGQQMLAESTHRLFGSTSSAISTDPSPMSPPLVAHRKQRSGSLGTISTLSRHSSTSSAESDRGQRHRAMNERFHLYLTSKPHEVLPSAAKNYPTSPRDENPPASDCASVASSSRAFGRGWRKSVRLSRSMFGG